MSVYNPAIPTSSQLLSVSQGQMLVNFTQLNTQFGVDHNAFESGASNGDGHHKQITFNAPPSTPTPTGTQSVIYPSAPVSNQELKFINSAKTVQIKNNVLV